MINITLKPEHEIFIQSQINTGKYNNPDEVVDLALKLLEKFNNEYQESIPENRQKVELAIPELDNGEGFDEKNVINDILERLKKVSKEHSTKIKAIIHRAEEGGYWAEVPVFPGCITEGDSLEEVTSNLQDAIQGWLDVAQLENHLIEPDTEIIEIAFPEIDFREEVW